MTEFVKKADWLNDKIGKKIYNPQRNDGLFVFFHKGMHKDKPYDKIGIVKFYDTKDGQIKWQCRRTKVGNKYNYLYDFVSIERAKVEELAHMLLELVGKEAEEIKAATKEDKLDEELAKIAEEFS